MARYTTTVRADRRKYPVLLSNGNLVASATEGDRHWARFVDPFRSLRIFRPGCSRSRGLEGQIQKRTSSCTSTGKLDQADWAMDCLKRAIAWDEKRFGLELDLDQ
jgi:aminopeptidase N